MSVRTRRALLAIAMLVALALALAVFVAGLQHSHDGAGTSSTASLEGGGEDASGAEATSSTGFDGAALPASLAVHDFALADQHGGTVSLGSLHGQVAVLAFLYSSCGATCVVIADQIRGALEELPGPVPVVFISADPAADTRTRIEGFLAQVGLSGRVEYLTGSQAQLAPVWRAYKVVPASAGRSAFDRYASVMLLDRSGHERVVYGLEQLTPEALAHDIRKLQGESG
ncbi:MAG TPA: SCO family protein [Solirubrobacteraceae bacterium]|nr:SCO family protein [Solirubrobacteraceae bacterium]